MKLNLPEFLFPTAPGERFVREEQPLPEQRPLPEEWFALEKWSALELYLAPERGCPIGDCWAVWMKSRV